MVASTPTPKKTGRFEKGNPGKPKGAKSHTTRTALEAIALAAEGLGGAARLQAWAKESPDNEKAFWTTVYPKLLPLQVSGVGGDPLLVQIVRYGDNPPA